MNSQREDKTIGSSDKEDGISAYNHKEGNHQVEYEDLDGNNEDNEEANKIQNEDDGDMLNEQGEDEDDDDESISEIVENDRSFRTMSIEKLQINNSNHLFEEGFDGKSMSEIGKKRRQLSPKETRGSADEIDLTEYHGLSSPESSKRQFLERNVSDDENDNINNNDNDDQEDNDDNEDDGAKGSDGSDESDSDYEEDMTLEVSVEFACELYSDYIKQSFPDVFNSSTSASSDVSQYYKRRTGVVYEDNDFSPCMQHEYPIGFHPERSDRIRAMVSALKQSGLINMVSRIPGRDAVDDEIRGVHMQSHIDFVRNLKDAEIRDAYRMEMATASVYANEFTADASFRSCGGVIALTEAVCDGRLRNGFAILRPPGHHAECAHAEGFCLFNNVAVAAAAALKKPGIRKVLIVDWDVHHGNGVQHAFEDNPDVLYFSVHRWEFGRFFPPGEDGGPKMVGIGPGVGYNINVAWNSVAPYGDSEYLACWNYVLLPAIRAFNPDLIMVSGGFDAGKGDMLGGCEVTSVGFAHMLHALTAFANGKIVLALEGGYNLRVLAENAITCTSVLLGAAPPPFKEPLAPPSPDSIASIRQTLFAHASTNFGGAVEVGWALHALSFILPYQKDNATSSLQFASAEGSTNDDENYSHSN